MTSKHIHPQLVGSPFLHYCSTKPSWPQTNLLANWRNLHCSRMAWKLSQLHRLHHPLSHPPDRRHLVDLWIPSIALLIRRTLGPPIRRHGAAETTTEAALPPHRRHSPSPCRLRSPSSCQLRSLLRHRPIRTTALMVSPTGKQAGQCPKKNGAAKSMARVVRLKAVAV